MHSWLDILDPDTCDHDAHTYYAFIHDPDTCMYDEFIHDPWSWYMHVWCIYLCSSILDYDACVYDAHIYVPRSLTMMHVCMMHISMILDLILKHACIYDAANFVPDGRTNKAILGVGLRIGVKFNKDILGPGFVRLITWVPLSFFESMIDESNKPSIS